MGIVLLFLVIGCSIISYKSYQYNRMKQEQSKEIKDKKSVTVLAKKRWEHDGWEVFSAENNIGNVYTVRLKNVKSPVTLVQISQVEAEQGSGYYVVKESLDGSLL